MAVSIFDKAARSEWQKLKQKNPTFEQSRPKDDLGPRMDRVVKMGAQLRAALDSIDKMTVALSKELQAMEQTVDSYANYVPAQMQNDFDRLQTSVTRTRDRINEQRLKLRKAGEDMKVALMT